MELYILTRKLNSHDNYVKLINLLFKKTNYIEMVLLDGNFMNILDKHLWYNV